MPNRFSNTQFARPGGESPTWNRRDSPRARVEWRVVHRGSLRRRGPPFVHRRQPDPIAQPARTPDDRRGGGDHPVAVRAIVDTHPMRHRITTRRRGLPARSRIRLFVRERTRFYPNPERQRSGVLPMPRYPQMHPTSLTLGVRIADAASLAIDVLNITSSVALWPLRRPDRARSRTSSATPSAVPMRRTSSCR